jgi:alpha,alpha-trehalose-phosphate synthase [UDP-forming]
MDGLVIVANRLPVEFTADGEMAVSPGGLVSAVKAAAPVGTRWIGWGGEQASRRGECAVDDLVLSPITLSDEEVEEFYKGFSNSLLWPLFHGRVRPVELRRSWWLSYRAVNERFATEAARVAPLGGTVWVHDYHLLLVPAALRALRPDLRIGIFLHIPFPNAQLLATLPWRRELLEGMLGADLVGFQSDEDVANFSASTSRLLRNPLRAHWTTRRGHPVHVDAFPISIDVDRWQAHGESAVEAASTLRRNLGCETLLFGVDRLDYTKGITQRLRAFSELLNDGRLDPATTTFVQVAVPSRGDVPGYDEEKDDVEGLLQAINERHRRHDGTAPVVYIDEACDEEQLAAWYRAADVLVVTPLVDGMNLVAKEFVATRSDHDGVLVLSEFAGAANELDGAVLVNPYDLEAMKAAFLQAVAMSPAEQARRMEAMREAVRANDVHHWAGRFLGRLATVAQGRTVTSRRERPQPTRDHRAARKVH